MSNSVVFRNSLQTKISQMNEDISSFMESKMNEFMQNMKTNIEQMIRKKLDHVYKNTDDDFGAILFDKDGSEIIKKTIDYLRKKTVCLNPEQMFQMNSQIDLAEKCLENEERTYQYNCFILESSYYTSNEFRENRIIYVFQNATITIVTRGNNSDRISICKHNLPKHVLFTIKHFQIRDHEDFERSLKVFEEHPEYFNFNHRIFENVFIPD